MHAENEIQVLPIEVANQIAAGEVVERPASVVKELLENAIDAGANRLEIAVSAAGRKLISVSDNGKGMGREDALLSIARHATSKIRVVGDIDAIRTLGFRGEALAAISSVSRFRLLTCRQGETVGTELVVQGGQMQDARDCGVPPGTRIEVRDLFYNVPARRKFLRTDQTELSHIRDVFLTHALAWPGLSLRLSVDGKELYRLAGAGTLADRLRDLFSPDLVAQLVPVSFREQGMAVSGYASTPLLHRPDRNEQYLFVNGRAVSPALLGFAIGEAYRSVLPKGRFPSVFLFLEMDAAQVDVNVHPAKKEIRFRRPMQVRDLVIAALTDALCKAAVVDQVENAMELGGLPEAVAPVVPASEAQLPIADLPPMHAFRYPRRPSQHPDLPLGGRPVDEVFAPSAEPLMENASGKQAPEVGAVASEEQDRGTSPWSWCRVMGQVGGIYVTLETEAGLVLMDPRAAHERVLYEKLRAVVALRRVPTQPLLLPETVTLTPRDAERLRQHLPAFQAVGFDVSDFGSGAFIVDAMPAIFEGASGIALIQQMLAGLDEGGRRIGREALEQSLIQSACHAAVGLRKQLSLAEIEKIVVDLSGCEMPYTSPRGRPTLILMSLRELHRKFGREAPAS